MQGKNRTYQRPPKPRDGTQPGHCVVPEANWFGPACEPQEEFVENESDRIGEPLNEAPNEKPHGPLSEGEPTFKAPSTPKR